MKSKIVACSAFIALLLLVAAGCARTKPNDAAQSPAAPTANSPTPQRIAVGDLAKLRWIEGTWRGTGDIDKPFYERYFFENDLTLVVEGVADETASKVTDVTRFD